MFMLYQGFPSSKYLFCTRALIKGLVGWIALAWNQHRISRVSLECVTLKQRPKLVELNGLFGAQSCFTCIPY
jgi:hypothetical protein